MLLLLLLLFALKLAFRKREKQFCSGTLGHFLVLYCALLIAAHNFTRDWPFSSPEDAILLVSTKGIAASGDENGDLRMHIKTRGYFLMVGARQRGNWLFSRKQPIGKV